MLNGKFFLHATNIHTGGGKTLLSAVIKSLPNSESYIVLLDSRMELPVGTPSNVQIRRTAPSILERIRTENWLRKNVKVRDVVLCFGNLPPIFKLFGRVSVFVQNRYLIDKIQLHELPLFVRLRIAIERMWLSLYITNANEFIVQTRSMKKLIEQKLKKSVSVRLLPFIENANLHSRTFLSEENGSVEYDFIYVASGEAHKNHKKLIDAWALLADEGIFPSLCLTLSSVQFDTLLNEKCGAKQNIDMAITNIGELSHDEIMNMYIRAGALIYPSYFESFGLPLIEAAQVGLPVLASELDYVRDILDPEQTFDPQSADSIARAVKRHMKLESRPIQLLTAQEFLGKVVTNDNVDH